MLSEVSNGTNGPLYAMGGAHPNAMTGLATSNREGKPAQREQEIYTPWEIVDVCLNTWPEGIALDPCSGPVSLVPAASAYTGVKIDTGDVNKDGTAITRWGGSGLIAPWCARTYVNMPYGDLEDWLHKSAIEHSHGNTEQILLFPVRPNRTWWCRYMAEIATSVAWLRPLKFVGFSSGFPAPLVLVHTGPNDPGLMLVDDTVSRFRAAVAGLSTFVGGPLS